jgi:Flp pilus assembly protein TadD
MLVRLKASRGDLEGALEESARLVKKYPHDEMLAINRAIVLLQTGHYEEYRRVSHELLEHAVKGPTNINSAKIALLLPVDGADFERACEWADTAATKDWSDLGTTVPPKAHLAKSLADYRRGQFKSANEWAQRVTSDSSAAKQRAAQAWILQAMACARLKQMEEARAALAKGDELLNQPHVDFIAGDGPGGGYGEWTVADLLRREAAELPELIPSTKHSPNLDNPTPVTPPKTEP